MRLISVLFSFVPLLISTSAHFPDVYGSHLGEMGAESCQMLMRLSKKLAEEEELTMTLLSLQGAMQMLLAGSSAGEASTDDTLPMLPSTAARQNLIISVS